MSDGDKFIDARLNWIESAVSKGLPIPSRDELAAFHDGFKAALSLYGLPSSPDDIPERDDG